MAKSPSPPPPTAPAIAEYPIKVIKLIVMPCIILGIASGTSTLKMVCFVVAPIESAASINPEETSSIYLKYRKNICVKSHNCCYN